ncbi:MAG: PAS domain S-box protein [Desulfobacterales bacterium]|nr:PAS domain S-box protein [Desulfobacteraceae bacterium]MBT4363634.1 PAS domain S-box protein [Desulfobacteraceae bacterium]MBT7084603.1 PAS domain S-box protein [Desulfobacterales bacterium]MBT7697673.1 PAS domain S-box protein [Desulfobacterales bacterium]
MARKPTYEELEQKVKEFESSGYRNKKEGEALKESEFQFDSLFQNIQTAIIIHGSNGEIIKCNDASMKLLGLTEDQMLEKKPSDKYWRLFYEDGSAIPHENYPVSQVVATRNIVEDFIVEAYWHNKDDNVILLVNASPVFNHDGSISQIILSFKDITIQKQAERRLQEREELMNATQRLTKVGGWEFDVEKQTTFWTDEVYQIHDIQISEDPKHLEQAIMCYDPENRQEIVNAFWQCVEKGKAYDFEFPFSTATGRRIWVKTSAEPVLKEDRIVKVLGNIMDITERKKSEERFKSIFNNSMDGILVADSKTQAFHDANPAVCQMLGYTRDEIRNLQVKDIHPAEVLPDVIEKFDGGVKNEINIYEDIAIKRKDGSIFYGDIHASPLVLGEQSFLVGSFRDTTERKKTKETLKQAHDELNERVKERTHELEELNTALTVLLKKRSEDKEQLENNLLSNLRTLIEPYLSRLKSTNMSKAQKTLIEILESNINEITAPFTSKLSSEYLYFSPTEIQVANLVKNGKTNKEVAEVLGVTRRTIEFHRENIRKKLGLKNKKTNLKTFLMTLK